MNDETEIRYLGDLSRLKPEPGGCVRTPVRSPVHAGAAGGVPAHLAGDHGRCQGAGVGARRAPRCCCANAITMRTVLDLACHLL
jgi:hypothetical protein